MTAGPDGIRDPAPNKVAAFTAVESDGFSGSSGRPIVISFSSLTPAPTHGAGKLPRASSWPTMSGPSRCSVAAKATWRLNRLELAEIEFDDRAQGFGHRAVLLIIGHRFQPG